MTDQTDPSAPDPTDPGPTEPPAPEDIIEEQDFEFSTEDMNRVAAEMFGDSDADSQVEDETEPGEQEDPTPPAAAGAEQPAGDNADAGDGTDAGVEEDRGAAASSTPAPPPTPDTPPVVMVGGQAYRPEDIEGLINWASSLTPEQLAALSPQQAPVDEPPTNPLPPEEELVDPRLAQWTETQLGSLEQKVDLLLEQQRAQQQILAQQQMAELNAALDKARRGVAEEMGLTDDEAMRLVEAANNNPAATAVVQNYDMNADPEGAFRAALTTAYWLTPEFRDRAITDQVTTQVAQQLVDNAVESRKSVNQGLVGAGAATPRQTTQVPQTEQEHLQAAIDLARQSMTAN